MTDLGGVARNVAENLYRLGCRVMLCSRVGNDEAGRRVLAQPFDTSWISVSLSRSTASYTAILDHTGELVVGLADMEIYEEVTPEVLSPAIPSLRTASMWFVDANLPGETLDWLIEQASGIPVAVDAISVAKSRRLAPLLPRIPYLFCNLAQAGSIVGGKTLASTADAARRLQERGARSGIVTAGAKGIAVYANGTIEELASAPADAVRDVTGAGDALIAGALYGLVRGRPLSDAARLGLAAAAITVESTHSVSPILNAEVLDARSCA